MQYNSDNNIRNFIEDLILESTVENTKNNLKNLVQNNEITEKNLQEVLTYYILKHQLTKTVKNIQYIELDQKLEKFFSRYNLNHTNIILSNELHTYVTHICFMLKKQNNIPIYFYPCIILIFILMYIIYISNKKVDNFIY